jgi:hypothetical protein
MDQPTRRDYFAATADVSWVSWTSTDSTLMIAASKKAGVPTPSTISINSVVKFWARAEIAWRWRYANLMYDGLDTGRTE